MYSGEVSLMPTRMARKWSLKVRMDRSVMLSWCKSRGISC